MSRWTPLWIVLALTALLLAGCGNPLPTEGPPPTQPPHPTQPPPDSLQPVPGATLQAPPVQTDGGTNMAENASAAGTAELTSMTPQMVCERVQGDSEAVYLLAVNVGKGDALILRAGDYVCLIDTGKTWAKGSVIQALAAMGVYGPEPENHLDAVFLTHTDDDHTGGLRWLSAEGDGELAPEVEAWYASAMYTGVKEKNHPAVAAARAKRAEVRWLRRGDSVPLGDTGATLRALAPASLYRDKDDNNSLVLLMESDQGRILLAGDMELPEEAELLSFGDELKCDVLKVPNHADDDTTSAAFAEAAGAQLALISTDSRQKPGTPDPGVVARLKAAGSRVLVTQDSGLGLFVALKGGAVQAARVEIDAPPLSGLYIAQVDAADDRVVLGNGGDAAARLDGCYLYSDKGDELFTFPEGCGIAPGETLIVGTRSTQGAYDVLWPDKKVVNRKKADTLYLYDSFGRMVDWRGNGME